MKTSTSASSSLISFYNTFLDLSDTLISGWSVNTTYHIIYIYTYTPCDCWWYHAISCLAAPCMPLNISLNQYWYWSSMFIILCKCLRMSMSRFLSKLIWAIVCDKVYRSCPDRVNMLGSISFTLGRQPLQTFVPLLNFVNANCCLGRKPLSLLFVWWIPWVCLVDHNDSPQLRSVARIGDCDPATCARLSYG